MTTTTPADQPQRDLIACELDRNMLVEAAAGTGKTESMVGRMISLLRTGKCNGPENLVAVTFTRKAAAELRARFQLRLEQALAGCDDPDESDRLRNALDGIERVVIATIHSFCARLLRERPVEAGVDVGFREIDEDEDEALRESTWSSFCNNAVAHDANGHVKALTDVGVALHELGSAFMKYVEYPDVESWPALPPGAPVPDFSDVIHELQAYRQHALDALQEVNHEKIGSSDALVPKYQQMESVFSRYDDLQDPLQLQALLGFFDKSAGSTKQSWFDKSRADEEVDEWKAFRSDVIQPALSRWYEYRYAILLPVLHEAAELYAARREEMGVLNFQDLLIAAARLLRENTAVRRYFSRRYTHILVDEFQDTDPVQAELLMLLASIDHDEKDWRKCVARPGSLFVVGDPKQSIYRFRRADIVTYNEFKERLINPGNGHEGGQLVTLTVNFRTIGPVIDWVNAQFEPGSEDGGAATGEPEPVERFPAESDRYSPAYVGLQAGRELQPGAELQGLFRIETPEGIGRKKSIPAEWEADRIARFIRGAIDNGMTVPRTGRELDAGISPAVGPSDFMIINFNKRSLHTYASALHSQGIPVTVTGAERMMGEIVPLRTLVAVLRAVLNPDDPVALIGALRSESFGVSDPALFRYKTEGGSFSYHKPVPAGLPAPDAELLDRCFSRLKRYRGWVDRFPVGAAFRKVADDLGLFIEATLREAPEMQAGALHQVLDMVREAAGERWTAQQAFDRLRGMVEEKEEVGVISALPGEKPSVRVMNLHKVKGLEAPVVFLAGDFGDLQTHMKKGRQVIHVDRTEELVHGYLNITAKATERTYTNIAQAGGWQERSEEELRFEFAEELRLRYVAATRAGSAIVITHRNKFEFNPWRFFSDDELKPLPDPGDLGEVAVKASPLGKGAFPAARARMKDTVDRLICPTYRTAAAKEYALSGPDAGEQVEGTPGEASAKERALLRGASGVDWGQAVHELLELVMKDPGADLGAVIPSILDRNELDQGLSEEIRNTVESVTASALWRRAEGAEERLTEVPFQMLVDDDSGPEALLVSGAIDLAFREDAGWVIADYKTDLPPEDGGYERLARWYAPQVRIYAKAWREICGEEPVEAGLYFTRSGEYYPVAD